MTNVKQRQVYRVCAVCGKRHGVTYGFGTILARNGIKGSKATIECIKKLGRTEQEQGRPSRP